MTEAGKKRYTKSDGVLKSNAYGRNGIDTNAYYENLRAKNSQPKKIVKSPYKSEQQGKTFSFKTAVDDLGNMVIKGNEQLGLKGDSAKYYSSEEVEEYLLQNYKGYWDMEDEKRWELQEKLCKELDKKGFHWID